MINTEQLIKRRAVSHDAYNLHDDSDEELRQITQMEHKESRNKKYHHGRRKRNYLRHEYFDKDSDFEYEDEEKAESERKLKSNSLPKGVFDKKPIKHNSRRSKSMLSHLVSSIPQSASSSSSSPDYHGRNNASFRPAVNGKRGHVLRRNGPQPDTDDQYGNLQSNGSKMASYEPQGGNQGFQTFHLTVYFGEYLQSEEPIQVEVTSPWTVSETIARAIAQWNSERPMSKLRGKSAAEYLMRQMDDDEMEDDLPPFAADARIHRINEKCVGLQFVRNFAGSVGSGSHSPMAETPEFTKSLSVMNFSNAKNQILVRVSIPGPYNESHVLPIDRDSTTLRLLDMISMLNKKKNGAHFHGAYFDFYHEGRTNPKDALSISSVIVSLPEPRTLVLLPRWTKSSDDTHEAFQFNLVKLANEVKEYKCTKIRKTARNMKRLLIVDRYRIVKKAMGDINIGTDNHDPIDIDKIVDLRVLDRNNKQFNIEYPRAGGVGTRSQVYELHKGVEECADFVNKVTFLIKLRKLYKVKKM